jgi:CheY-like chemotaxis protein
VAPCRRHSRGYELTEAENGEQALAAVAKQRPDLILMDIQLPVMDGYEKGRPMAKKQTADDDSRMKRGLREGIAQASGRAVPPAGLGASPIFDQTLGQ